MGLCSTGLLIPLLLAATPVAPPEAAVSNPLLQPWQGPYGGVPPFDAMPVPLIQPALEEAMAAQLREVERIASDPAAPTFQNTLAALENAERPLLRVLALYEVYATALSTPEFQPVELAMAPKLAAHQDKILQNEKLFARLAALYDARERSGLTPEQQRLAWLYYTNFVRAGAKLQGPAKVRVAAINERLASLFTTFAQNLLGEEEGLLLLDPQQDAGGLPASFVAATSAAAESLGHKGKLAILNTRSSVEPFLTYSTRRDLREKVWRAFVNRGDNGDARDTKALITEIFQLRTERAKLLGYPTHAAWRLEDSMAKTPERAMALLDAVWPAAVARVQEEVAEMQAIANAEQAGITIEPWDYRYYAEKVRKSKYDLDENEVKPYLQLEKLREAMFWVAGQLLDFHFSPAAQVPVYHPDVRVWEVKKGDGRLVGLFYFDPYARKGKRSGAWMNAYRNQERFAGEFTTIVSNNSNFVPGKPGEPVLVSWSDAETLFHEFGHALHGLSSNVSYPSLSGTAVARDYVEFPSQILERWLATPEVLNKFAVHVETGKPIPQELVAKIERASTFRQGFDTVEYLAAAIIDMRGHLITDRLIEPAAFEGEVLGAIGMPKQIVLRHRLPQFLHLFSSDGYSAAYYSYLWADTLSADAYEAFTEAKGPYDPEVAKRLRVVLSLGNTIDPAEAYRQFRGRDPGIGALMRTRGFPVPPTASQPAAKP
ncbi:MAG: M3 family metallopeptidase [Myxococcota bacterium]|jgi:peptidyl-dipeptidase Dcp|nr:M3 family metallopeptidase [Myxococcota bacterium]